MTPAIKRYEAHRDACAACGRVDAGRGGSRCAKGRELVKPAANDSARKVGRRLPHLGLEKRR